MQDCAIRKARCDFLPSFGRMKKLEFLRGNFINLGICATKLDINEVGVKKVTFEILFSGETILHILPR